ncbi:LemA family protein [Prevotella brunnea]|uniref:LemA family protein n=1 Tax=Prevotella brunnea TaxID=2508867 RepID=A0A5C8GNG6_9BACT|nr:LemA family protein [Prevotella brunnea]MDR0185790.1 LemA family protein [Prevotella brunnea]TXJ63486.1 LemA family protein [Prevotella brunnea]
MKNKTLLIVIGVVLIIGLWLFSGYNGMVDKEESATTALSNIEAAYQRRADMMPQLAKIVKAYAKHEKETFEAVTKARNAATQIHLDANNLTPESIQKFETAQSQLAQAFSRLIAVAESYPELKANANFLALQKQEEGTENRINEARRKYNESVQDYNRTIRHFPNSLIAHLFGFDKMVKFQSAKGAEKAPDLDI